MQPRTHSQASRQELELWTLDDADAWKEAELFADSEAWTDEDPLVDNDLWTDADCVSGLTIEGLGQLGIRVS